MTLLKNTYIIYFHFNLSRYMYKQTYTILTIYVIIFWWNIILQWIVDYNRIYRHMYYVIYKVNVGMCLIYSS